ncbi:hypothetical protein FOFC_01265 [Fusarium oxysporum]|nr:hypothetical protein FOFC_01265 [Fusarium oxysporum]
MGVSSGIEARFVWNESLASRHGWIRPLSAQKSRRCFRICRCPSHHHQPRSL